MTYGRYVQINHKIIYATKNSTTLYLQTYHEYDIIL